MHNSCPNSINPRLSLKLVGGFVLCLLMVFSTLAAAQDSRDPRQHFFIQSFGDLPDELALARKQGKQGIFLFFEMEGCPYCQKMLKNVFSRKDIQEWYQEHFMSIAIDIRGDVEIKDFDGIILPSKIFSEQRKVYMTPVLSFIDLDGIEIYRHLGMVKTPEEFMVMGDYIVGKHYFDTEFGDYATSRGIKDTGGSPLTSTEDELK